MDLVRMGEFVLAYL